MRRVLFVVPANRDRDGAMDVSCFVTEQASALERTRWPAGIFPLTGRRSPAGLVRSLRELRARIVSEAPAVVHAQYGSVTAAVSVLASNGIPVVVSFCGDDLLGTPVKGLVWRLRERLGRRMGVWAAGRAAGIVVKSANLMQALPPALRGRAVVLPNGVDLELFRPEDRNACRQQMGWDRDEPIVVFNASVGEDQAVKNLALAERAMQTLRETHPRARLVLLSRWDRELVRCALNAADCLLVTSLHEGSPNIVKEAMACNLPVVSVDCGDVAERLDGVRPGAVCGYDSCAIGQALSGVLERRERSNGRARLIEQGLDGSSVAGRLAELYVRVTGAPSASPVDPVSIINSGTDSADTRH